MPGHKGTRSEKLVKIKKGLLISRKESRSDGVSNGVSNGMSDGVME